MKTLSLIVNWKPMVQMWIGIVILVVERVAI